MVKKSYSRKTREFALAGQTGYTITVSGLPGNITPRLLPISREQKSQLLELRKDGNIGEITSIAGNLVFYDEHEAEVHYFASPVTLTYNFTASDETKRLKREAKLRKTGRLAELETVSLIPIFLYQYMPNKVELPEFEVWQPFQNFLFDEKSQTVTIKFRFWGDQPIGGGTQP